MIEHVCDLTFALLPLQAVPLGGLNDSPGEANSGGGGDRCSEDLLLLTL